MDWTKIDDADIEAKLAVIDEVASNLWGKDMRNAADIASAVCLPIFKYIDKLLRPEPPKEEK